MADVTGVWNAVIRDTLINFTTEEKTEAGIAADIAARGKLYLVAELDGVFAGFATCAPFRSGTGYALTHEHSIMLAKAGQGRGVGRALMAALEANARAAGVHVLVAVVSSANPGGVAFHERLGYVHVGTFPEVGRKWGQWLDAVFLQKILDR